MQTKADETYLGPEGKITLRIARTGILAGFMVYALFGILDPFMVPSQYEKIWMVRFGIVCPVIFMTYLFSYSRLFPVIAKPLLKTLLFIGELGILGMIYISKPEEGAFLGYYAGLLLIILWSGFVFRFNFRESMFYFISILILYNIIAITRQDILSYPINSLEYGTYIGNNFFLSATGLLSLIGTNYLNKFYMEITEKNKVLKNEQEALNIAKDKAEESDRLKTAFLTNMSHEIRTPMNGIIGFSELYLDKDSSADEKERYAKIVIDSSKQLLRIVNDILDLSKIETNQVSIHKSSQDINKRLEHLKSIFSNRFHNKPIEMILEYPDEDPCIIFTDHTRLYQIISNLIENAFKFTKEGNIKFGYEKKADHLLFFVKDTGIGIAKNYQSIIFERFRQLETSQTKEFSGAGLGLSITRHLVSLLGGEIWIESEENRGSEFYFTLPLYENPEEKLPESRPPLSKRKLSNSDQKHILIAEDEEHNYLLLKTYLKNTDVKIGHASDGLEAISYAENNQDIDLILMDIKMPNIDGLEAMKHIKKDHADIPVIAQTAFVMAEDKEKLLKLGFDDYLPKPIESKALFEILNKYFNKAEKI